MTTFKPGDKVTSPLLVGEWEVIGYDYADDLWVWLANGKERIRESRYRLTLVAPPLPPEPPVGTVECDHLWPCPTVEVVADTLRKMGALT